MPWVCSLVLLGCSDAGAVVMLDASTSMDAGRDADAADARVDRRCIAPDGVSSSPHSIAEVVTLLNALPKPVTLPCFVDSLARPLSLQADDSTFSAQPSKGRRSPRVFVFFAGLTVSVAPDGTGARLLELGEAREENRSLKAELEFPIADQLDEAAPYQRVYYSDAITTCGFCHQGEVRASDVASPYAFVSPALRPVPMQRVPLDELRTQLMSCDDLAEPERCALLRALFRPDSDTATALQDGAASPIEHDFPMTYKTF